MDPTLVTTSSNILAALLNHAFYCYLCCTTHRSGSASIRRCLESLNTSTRGFSSTAVWSPSITTYERRQAYRKSHNRWTDQDTETYDRLIIALALLALHDEKPTATLTELASPTGREEFQQRYDAWTHPWSERVKTTTTTATPLLRALDALLPPPHPVGPPTGTRCPIKGLIPTLDTERELQRVHNLLGTKTKRSIHNTTIKLKLHRFGTLSRRSLEPIHRLEKLFWVTDLTWTISSLKNRYFNLDDLGLDPAFWQSVVLYGGTLTLTTHPFTFQSPEPLMVSPTSAPTPPLAAPVPKAHSTHPTEQLSLFHKISSHQVAP